MILSNQFNDAAVAAVWSWYGNRDDKVKCSRQTLRPPPLDPESENLPSPPQSNASAVQSELPLEPSFKVLTIESEMKPPTGKLHVTESVLELPCQLTTLDSELELDPTCPGPCMSLHWNHYSYLSELVQALFKTLI